MKQTEYLPHIAYDSVIIGFTGDELKILIMEYHNTGLYALPGGFVKKNEDLNEAAKRGLEERTGLKNIFLEQFYTFGDTKRHQPEVLRTIIEANEKTPHESLQWLLDRFISVAYYALINYHDVVPKPDALSDSCTWYPLKKLPPLILDHADIVNRAIFALRENIDRKLVTVNLLPATFTMKELQHVYEAILDTNIRRTTFQRQMLASELLVRHDKRYSGKAHKAPYVYSFKAKKP